MMEKVNEFKLLKLLNLTGFKFTENLTLNLPNLKKLTLDTCQNISFADKSLLNLKKLLLLNCSINKQETILTIDNLIECKLSYMKTDNNIKYYEIFDFSKFKHIKKLVVNPEDFIHIDSDDTMENLELVSLWDISTEIQIKTFEKILKMKNLKNISLEFGKIDENEISKINGENITVKNIQINRSK